MVAHMIFSFSIYLLADYLIGKLIRVDIKEFALILEFVLILVKIGKVQYSLYLSQCPNKFYISFRFYLIIIRVLFKIFINEIVKF